ncbi:unnamed protein product [Soboliphyme baturini]|uniref:Secreted protein n=1 Tax=Soboliphyme baturini TaxID=241478 RepID=A0A183IP31_9BILA|nr:unnamed protein product [Soboliphyme baturini]
MIWRLDPRTWSLRLSRATVLRSCSVGGRCHPGPGFGLGFGYRKQQLKRHRQSFRPLTTSLARAMSFGFRQCHPSRSLALTVDVLTVENELSILRRQIVGRYFLVLCTSG